MKVINSGSSTLKCDLVEVDAASEAGQPPRKLAYGLIDRIGHEGTIDFRTSGAISDRGRAAIGDHRPGVGRALSWLHSRVMKILSEQTLKAGR